MTGCKSEQSERNTSATPPPSRQAMNACKHASNVLILLSDEQDGLDKAMQTGPQGATPVAAG